APPYIQGVILGLVSSYTPYSRRPPLADTGRCRAYFPRWFYDAETQTCQNFTYGGCPGNLNNHLEDESDCTRTCVGEAAQRLFALRSGRS
uniref:BPTI/Kunitz inhibitor domain-containing protein n=1 Tax=Leptobrachium leishanense TaxID=445787 RepID=A0A8C5QYC7_9ANUR